MRNGTATRVVFALTAALLGAASAGSSGATESGVKAGYLKCDVEGNVSFVFGSSRDVNCTYTPDGKGRVDRYTGTIDKYGVDIGRAVAALKVGEHAHVHNIKTKRW